MNLFAERLKSARIKAGYTLRDLAVQLDGKLSFQALSQYENGLHHPDSEKLSWLCEALNVRPDYFIRTTVVELSKIEFRKLQRTPEKSKNRFLEAVKDYLERYLELEELVGNYKKAEDGALEKIKVHTEKEAEAAANTLRKRWNIGLDPITHIVNLVEDKGILYLEVPAEPEIDGVSTVVESVQKFVLVKNSTKEVPIERIRFTIAHELGHLIMDIPESFDKKTSEKLCNRFAGAFLLPGETLKKEIGEKCHRVLMVELNDLKIEYGVSISAILYRMKDLEIITDHYFKYWMTYLSQIGYRKEEPSEYSGKETSRRFEQLLMRAVAEEWVSVSKAAALKNMKLTEFRAEYLKN